jgi:uncharacterized protein (DUF1810 family)
MAEDRYDLARFVDAQQGVHELARAELRQGRKRSHWMWFVFPQIAGLGRSAMAQRYAIRSAGEARAYLDHPVLGPRLIACVADLATLPGTLDATQVMGGVDALKLRSSLTLFEAVGGAPFADALDRWFGGERDAATLSRLAAAG